MFREILAEAGRGYRVIWGDDENNESFETTKPSFAIAKWVNKQRDNEKNVVIYPIGKKDVQPFYQWIHDNTETFVKMVGRQGAYKPKYLYQETQTVNIQKDDLENGLTPFTIG